jgi:transposase-like protein
MSRKGKIDPVIKVKAVEEVISGRSSISAEAKKVGVDDK